MKNFIKDTITKIKSFSSKEIQPVGLEQEYIERIYTVSDMLSAIDNAIEITNAIPNFTLSQSVVSELEKAKQFANIR